MKHKRSLLITFVAGFLYTIPVALTSYINSTYLKEFFSSSYISGLYVASAVVGVLSMIFLPDFLNKIGNRHATSLFALLACGAFYMLATSRQAPVIAVSFIASLVLINFIVATLDIFVEDFSSSKSIGTLRGLYLTCINTAWIVSQVFSGSIFEKSSYRGMYVIGSLFMGVVSVIFLVFLRNFKDPVYTRSKTVETFRFFIRNTNILRIYLVNFILKFFFVWMIIYTPMYLHEYIGFTWREMGYIFTIMLTPFVFLSYPLGKISDKIGERTLLLCGFIIGAVATALIPLIGVKSIALWAAVLFFTRVGAASIEVLSESYFFKVVSEEHSDAISFFRNTASLSYIIAPLVAIPLLAILPSFSYLFFILSVVLLAGLYITLRMKDVK
jgi:MFS family permease